MARIAVTGAAGNVGRETLEALEGHDVKALTHREHDDLSSEILEVTDEDAFVTALEGTDTVVHLAANPSPSASWDSVSSANIDGTHNCFEAARRNDLDRVVFASTNHVTQMYNTDDRTRPESLVASPRAVHTDEPTRPDSYYAVSKVAGEALGSYYADRHGIEVVNLRIGWLLTPEQLRERQIGGAQADDESLARYARAMWLSPRDCRDAVSRAVEATLPENPLTVNVVSANTERYLSITHTMRSLGYDPRDNSADVVESTAH